MEEVKILCLADLHSQISSLNKLDAFLSKNRFDLVFFAGDLTNREKSALNFAREFFNLMKKYDLSLFYVHGNNEPMEVIEFFEKNNCNLHYRIEEYKGYRFAGVGGYGEMNEQEMKRLKDFNITDTILVTHLPPKTKNKTFLQKAPKIHLCGHWHKNGSIWYLGKTKVVLIPPAEKSQGAILYLPSQKIEFIKF